MTTLTKRMAEDLTDYLCEHGVRVRYLHSDIDTVERVEIIRDLRLGRFDVLVGINLLREGLGSPGGFLGRDPGCGRGRDFALGAIADSNRRPHRPATSPGGAMMYANEVTGSMERALAEMARRRIRQVDYNVLHGITPRGVTKAVTELIEVSYAETAPRRRIGVKESESDYRTLAPEQALQKIKKLEEKMFRHARDLEFEQAAQLRDEIGRITRRCLGSPRSGRLCNLREIMKRGPRQSLAARGNPKCACALGSVSLF